MQVTMLVQMMMQVMGDYRNLTWRECEDETHTPKMGTWESSETFESLEFNCEGQNSSP